MKSLVLIILLVASPVFAGNALEDAVAQIPKTTCLKEGDMAVAAYQARVKGTTHSAALTSFQMPVSSGVPSYVNQKIVDAAYALPIPASREALAQMHVNLTLDCDKRGGK